MITKNFKNDFLSVPKLEIHLHLEGAASPGLVKKLANQKRIDLSYIFDEKGSYNFTNFNEFLMIYDKVSKIFTSPEDFYKLTEDVISNLHKDNVIYSEIFISPDFCGNSDLVAWREYLDAISSAIMASEKKYDINIRLIPICIRHLGVEKAKKAAKCAAEVDSRFIVGFGMAGDENYGLTKDYKYSFDLAKEAGLKLTSHAGELSGHNSILETIKLLNVTRIGHGVNAFTDKETMKTLKEKKITLEICPKSNLILGLFNSLKNHPIQNFYHEEINFLISTDDPTFFNITLSDEYKNLFNEFGWNDKFFYELNLKGVDSIFGGEKLKKLLKKKYLN